MADVCVTIALCLTPEPPEKFLMIHSYDGKPPIANVEPTTLVFKDKQAFLDFLVREGGKAWDGYSQRL